ncbi:excisionase [Clostridium botulinum]|uniref:excisionase n=1 Tax=Clostridium botulinum TaxID=1491 RepID=UPI000773EEC2|nr:excisionase [Clostridium botulinum]MBY6931876.1 excisionase family DNA-binding protein [Clostridium botulinum]NFG20558.1 helix-turn-helix domain-containing protein [Clostridium botulinum]NFO32471.1 helix-turn-helix domain-containing protein [Clostridium botulinum]NFO81116.1 helix-turn-helix domain-containing protein [Clostridium botulinum]
MTTNEILKEILQTIKTSNKATMTVIECSDYMNVSKDKIRELVNKVNTDFPYFKVGAKVLIDKARLDLWIESIAKEHRKL